MEVFFRTLPLQLLKRFVLDRAFVGLGKGVKSICPEQFLHKRAILFGSKVMPANLYWEMTRFMLDKHVRFESLVTHRMALEDGPEAFAKFDAGAAGKFIFEMP